LRTLLIHQNFPGQFRWLVPALLEAGHAVAGIGAGPGRPAWREQWPDLLYRSSGGDPGREQPGLPGPERHQAQWRQGERVARQLLALQAEGWRPDVVLGHPFWGDLLHLDTVFPSVPLVALMEIDLSTLAGRTALEQWTDLVAMRRMDRGLSATHFQRSTYPSWVQDRITVIHEGVDLSQCRPEALPPRLTLPDGRILDAGTPLITFATRNLEPLRGYDTFLRALPEVLAHHPRAQVLICGSDQASYGPAPPDGRGWTQALRRELAGQLDERRVHWLGLVPHRQLLELFRLSRVHVYLTEPYVLSWSLLEAMACGALVVASDTAPVREVIRHGHEGWLVPPRDPGQLAAALLEALHHPERGAPLRLAARRHVLQHYDQRACSRRRITLLEELAA